MNKFKKQNQSGENHEGEQPNSPVNFLTASSIIGDKVRNPSGENLGSIKEIMIDINNGNIEYIVIELGGFLGIGEKLFAIPFSLLTLDAKFQRFILNQSKETLENAPGFDNDQWPETNIHKFDPTTAYWGVYLGSTTGGRPR